MTEMKGVERFLTKYDIKGTPALQVREWARDSMYWNAFMLLDPADIAVIVMGAPSNKEMEKKFVERIERKLGLLP